MRGEADTTNHNAPIPSYLKRGGKTLLTVLAQIPTVMTQTAT
jgi:hypothetical protein